MEYYSVLRTSYIQTTNIRQLSFGRQLEPLAADYLLETISRHESLTSPGDANPHIPTSYAASTRHIGHETPVVVAMTFVLSPAKLVLLAVRLVTSADIDDLAELVRQHPGILRRDLVLRIILTHLPETTRPARYVPLIEELASGKLVARLGQPALELDLNGIEDLSEDEATKRARRLHLLPLTWTDAPFDTQDDPVTQFLLRRAYRVDEAAGLSQVVDLIAPFIDHTPELLTWSVSTLLPLFRRNFEYYPQAAVPHTLAQFSAFSHRETVAFLLSETGTREDNLDLVGRDLRGMVGPWMASNDRWQRNASVKDSLSTDATAEVDGLICPAWERVLEWLTFQASKNWKVAAQAFAQWNGPGDVDFKGLERPAICREEAKLSCLAKRFTRAILASAYLVPDGTMDALSGSHQMLLKAMTLLNQDAVPELQQAAMALSPMSYDAAIDGLATARNATYMRNDLLSESNPLTSPTPASIQLLYTLILAAFLLTQAGSPCTVKRAGDLVFLQDEREQKAEALKLIHNVTTRAPKNNDFHWSRAREELLWLWNWGRICDTVN